MSSVLVDMLTQNAKLLAHLTESKDPLTALTSGTSTTDSGGGVRGCAARLAWQQKLKSDPDEVLAAFRRLLAFALDVEPDQLGPAALRTFVERKSPLGNMRGLKPTKHCVLASMSWFSPITFSLRTK